MGNECYDDYDTAKANAGNLWFSTLWKSGDEFCTRPYHAGHWFMFVLTLITGTISIFTSFALLFIFFRRRIKDCCREEKRDERTYALNEKPAITAIIPCYMPNEQGIIEETVMKVITRVKSPGPLTVMVAYNTPTDLPEIEQKLKMMEAQQFQGPDGDLRRFRSIRVMESKSKAANLNYSLRCTTDPYCIIYDADHWPDPNSLLLLWEKMYRLDMDCVQGSYYMRNLEANQWGCCPPCTFPFLSRIIDAEFFLDWFFMKGLTRTFFMGRGYFCGSNALWRKASLEKLVFDTEAQTEDVDMAIRQLLKGAKIDFCAESRSGELAPQGCCACYKQRLRWNMGWDQVSMKHAAGMTSGDNEATCRTRCGLVWTFLVRWVLMTFMFSSIFIILPWQIYSFIHQTTEHGEIMWMTEDNWGKGIKYFSDVTFMTIWVPMLVSTIEAMLQAGHRGCQSWIQVIFVAFVASPLGFMAFFIYTLFLQLVSCFKVLTNNVGGWEVTKRGAIAVDLESDTDEDWDDDEYSDQEDLTSFNKKLLRNAGDGGS